MKELVLKTIFFCSPEETNLEFFIEEFLDICGKYELNFKEICCLFEKILALPHDDE